MEDSTSSNKENSEPKILHCEFKSIKYKAKIEVFWSENFIKGLRNFNNRALTNAFSLIDKVCNTVEFNEMLPQDWIITKDIKDNYTSEELEKTWILPLNQLIEKIEIDMVAKDLEKQLEFEESKSEEQEDELFVSDINYNNSLNMQ